ncbi:unnamed protein product [Angiostrongylus costaricensis]|uniref:DSHCT domain-containing protein n=1 Tax=Angiostrongylus costaricensis TaxID=334426 RepID=A0A0R3PWB1_ANGCS|nr:unnamed protein product [Angiostrongylus costaricensis]
MAYHDQAEQEYKTLCDELRKAQSVQQLEELDHRKRVLRRLECADKSDIITVKLCGTGCCACELSASNELMLTEMFYGGVFTDLTPAQIAALLSCLVFQEYARRTAKLSVE